ncbi:hypothetical protein ASPZODRAFT_12144 [Penicilliopsis zonata CBS 506.65]|uniref:Fork-head domain-containing protein n=1 Tax=Penicilliopsis zonata CBS 506.65 TaxID=1073090 RepID=A0A1L9SVV0_9EURO|nr:hypothetical protein ASPZODRAFT_12144 [Penicilliopsis zonata CBS 506.65]OJJ51306.1 hypothetical protein ASPZODRAFT_12144 [Penicilliopsis zonata CBS 506.65]
MPSSSSSSSSPTSVASSNPTASSSLPSFHCYHYSHAANSRLPPGNNKLSSDSPSTCYQQAKRVADQIVPNTTPLTTGDPCPSVVPGLNYAFAPAPAEMMPFPQTSHEESWIKGTAYGSVLNQSQIPRALLVHQDGIQPFSRGNHHRVASHPVPMAHPSYENKCATDWSTVSHLSYQHQHSAGDVIDLTHSTRSPSISSASYQTPGPSDKTASFQSNDTDGIRTSSKDANEDKNVELPYSTLIYQALINTSGNMLSLQEIYKWFEENTSKGKDKSKGWQNSVRHNLSMNAAFEAVKGEPSNGKKGGNLWRLTEEAIQNGVMSTTRFRKQATYKRTMSSDSPAPQRQQSGAKGGKAARNSARLRGQEDKARKEKSRQQYPAFDRPRQTPVHPPPAHMMWQFHTPVPHPPNPPHTADSLAAGLETVVGCTHHLPPSLFCDMPGSGPDYSHLNLNFGLGAAAVFGINSNGYGANNELPTDLQLGV